MNNEPVNTPGKPPIGPMVAAWLKVRETTRNPPEWGRKGTRPPATSEASSQPENATQAVLGAGKPGETTHA